MTRYGTAYMFERFFKLDARYHKRDVELGDELIPRVEKISPAINERHIE